MDIYLSGTKGADGTDGQDGINGVDGINGQDEVDGDKGFDGNSAKWTFQYDNNFPIDINDPTYIDGDFITIAAGAVTNDKSAVEKIHIKNIDSQLPGTDMTNWLSSTQLQVGQLVLDTQLSHNKLVIIRFQLLHF